MFFLAANDTNQKGTQLELSPSHVNTWYGYQTRPIHAEVLPPTTQEKCIFLRNPLWLSVF